MAKPASAFEAGCHQGVISSGSVIVTGFEFRRSPLADRALRIRQTWLSATFLGLANSQRGRAETIRPAWAPGMPPGANRFSFVRQSLRTPTGEGPLRRLGSRSFGFRHALAVVTTRPAVHSRVAPNCDMLNTMSSPEPARAENRPRHRPVLLREVVRALELEPGMIVVDGTVGAGGHSSAILLQIRPDGRLIGLDRDPLMLAFASHAAVGGEVVLVHSSYADLRHVLDELGVSNVDRVLLDLGLSSDQLADRERGFSFEAAGPLDLRFDMSKGVPASAWLDRASASEISDTLRTFGEEPFADRLADAIVAARKTSPIETAADLAKLVADAIPPKSRRGTSHPATRVFQALRIAINDELGELDRMLNVTLPACLASGGIAAIISFHSLEDRMLKNAFRNAELWEQPAAKAIAPTPSEVRFNPRSRSAKLRVAKRR